MKSNKVADYLGITIDELISEKVSWGGERMEIRITGYPKEIADLISVIQSQQSIEKIISDIRQALGDKE